VVIIGGRSGTLGELAIAYDEGKLIGVLTGTGGISDMVADILGACAKGTGAQVVYDPAPLRLVKKLLRIYRTSHFRRPSCFCQDRPPGEDGTPAPGMLRDPVCGMGLVPEAAAAKRTLDGQLHVFCSAACVERFDADTLKYAPRSNARV
jgi:YHS domain-containing protein